MTKQYLKAQGVLDIELLECIMGKFDLLITADVNMEYQPASLLESNGPSINAG